MSLKASSRPGRTTTIISSISLQASKRSQVCATTGRPATSRKSLSTLGPMRVPRPAATMMAKVIGRNFDRVVREDQLAIWELLRLLDDGKGVDSRIRDLLNLATGPGDLNFVNLVGSAEANGDRQ